MKDLPERGCIRSRHPQVVYHWAYATLVRQYLCEIVVKVIEVNIAGNIYVLNPFEVEILFHSAVILVLREIFMP